MSEERLYKLFQQSIEAKMDAGEVLIPDIIEAGHMMVECLLDEGKILLCGNGPSAALAQIFANHLINRFERERPSLPCLTLGCVLTNVSSVANEQSFNEIFAKEIKALGSDKDILIIFSSSGNSSNLLQAIKAAHEKNIRVIALNGHDGGNISTLLDVNDKELRVPSNSRGRIHEVHLLIIFCLCDYIDQQLFGSTE
ncbi:MAG: D-sedoheptulose 7-phosphate isomerase [Cellvibrionaceae bacterium]|jgi:D-sedoheptulose 7-phosphate isomerase